MGNKQAQKATEERKRQKDCVLEENGIILFNPGSQYNVAGAEKFTYNEYLDVQFAS